ncbi:hypothetical protein CP8484711_0486, partial [Chlamydia psittaci 84-8471/1]
QRVDFPFLSYMF